MSKGRKTQRVPEDVAAAATDLLVLLRFRGGSKVREILRSKDLRETSTVPKGIDAIRDAMDGRLAAILECGSYVHEAGLYCSGRFNYATGCGTPKERAASLIAGAAAVCLLMLALDPVFEVGEYSVETAVRTLENVLRWSDDEVRAAIARYLHAIEAVARDRPESLAWRPALMNLLSLAHGREEPHGQSR
jgi:hypothetical protein